eukprot:Rmarinus@m.12080
MRLGTSLAFLLGGFGALANAASIAGGDKRVAYTGRIMVHEPVVRASHVEFDWPCVYSTVKFRGSSLEVELEGGDNYFNVFVDGDQNPHKVLATDGRSKTYELVSGLNPDEEHTVILSKSSELCSQLFFGCTDKVKLYEWTTDGEFLDAAHTHKNRLLEIYGDSESTGFAVLATTHECDFVDEWNDCFYGAPATLARSFNADYHITAGAAKGLTANAGVGGVCSKLPDAMLTNSKMCLTIPQLYDRTLVSEVNGKVNGNEWDFATRVPDVALVWIGGNDVYFGLPDEPEWSEEFITAYYDFLVTIREAYPDADKTKIVAVCGGPLETEHLVCDLEAEAVRRFREKVDSTIVNTVVPRDQYVYPDDFGCLEHLNLQGTAKTVDTLREAVKEATGWE